MDGKHEIKKEHDCFRQLFRRDFPLSVGSSLLMFFFIFLFFTAALPRCSRKLAPVLGGGVLAFWKPTQADRERCGSPPHLVSASFRTWCSHVSACGCW